MYLFIKDKFIDSKNSREATETLLELMSLAKSDIRSIYKHQSYFPKWAMNNWKQFLNNHLQ